MSSQVIPRGSRIAFWHTVTAKSKILRGGESSKSGMKTGRAEASGEGRGGVKPLPRGKRGSGKKDSWEGVPLNHLSPRGLVGFP